MLLCPALPNYELLLRVCCCRIMHVHVLFPHPYNLLLPCDPALATPCCIQPVICILLPFVTCLVLISCLVFLVVSFLVFHCSICNTLPPWTVPSWTYCIEGLPSSQGLVVFVHYFIYCMCLDYTIVCICTCATIVIIPLVLGSAPKTAFFWTAPPLFPNSSSPFPLTRPPYNHYYTTCLVLLFWFLPSFTYHLALPPCCAHIASSCSILPIPLQDLPLLWLLPTFPT